MDPTRHTTGCLLSVVIHLNKKCVNSYTTSTTASTFICNKDALFDSTEMLLVHRYSQQGRQTVFQMLALPYNPWVTTDAASGETVTEV